MRGSSTKPKLPRALVRVTVEHEEYLRTVEEPIDATAQRTVTLVMPRAMFASGMVVDAEFDPGGICHCLYIAQIARAENAELQLLDQPGIPIRNVELPYSMEN